MPWYWRHTVRCRIIFIYVCRRPTSNGTKLWSTTNIRLSFNSLLELISLSFAHHCFLFKSSFSVCSDEKCLWTLVLWLFHIFSVGFRSGLCISFQLQVCPVLHIPISTNDMGSNKVPACQSKHAAMCTLSTFLSTRSFSLLKTQHSTNPFNASFPCLDCLPHEKQCELLWWQISQTSVFLD